MKLAALLLAALPTRAQTADIAGSGLVGKLEGPALVTDPAQWPHRSAEAPMLAAQVTAGKLPGSVTNTALTRPDRLM